MNNSTTAASAHTQGSGKTPACCQNGTGATHSHSSNPTQLSAQADQTQQAPQAPQASLQHMTSHTVVRIALIAALNCALTLICLLALSGLAWGPIQFRVSEAVCVLALFMPEAIGGLTLGCVLANIINITVSGAGALGLLDVVFGSFATALGAWFTWHYRNRPLLALAGPVVANALIVPAYLPLLLSGLGFYTIPFTTIALDNSYVFMYIFGVVTIGIGEGVVIYAIGYQVYRVLAACHFDRFIKQENN